jgi:hypothetical protein
MAIITAQTYSQDILAVGSRMSQDVVVNQSLATNGNYTYDVECATSDWLTVMGDLTGAAVTDLVISVFPFEGDNLTLSPVALTQASATPTVGVAQGGHVYVQGRYDIGGIGRVRIQWHNANAGTQTLTRGSWRTENWT